MTLYAGLDVSVRETSGCVIDDTDPNRTSAFSLPSVAQALFISLFAAQVALRQPVEKLGGNRHVAARWAPPILTIQWQASPGRTVGAGFWTFKGPGRCGQRDANCLSAPYADRRCSSDRHRACDSRGCREPDRL